MDACSRNKASIAAGASVGVRAAASSSAKGKPSSRRQSSATAVALSAVTAKWAAVARARCAKRATAGAARTASRSTTSGDGTKRVGTARTCSSCSRKGARQVASTCTAGQPAEQRPDEVGDRGQDVLAVVEQEEALLRSETRDEDVRRHRSGAIGTARAAATVAGTSAASATGARSTQTIPSAKWSATPWARARARRVLPTPPGPVNVKRGTSSSRSRRPGAGTFCFPTDEPGAWNRERRWQDQRGGSDHATFSH